MSDFLELVYLNPKHTMEPASSFSQDVITGLNKVRKQIPSKYFYDDDGSLLFNQITRHEDYYLTQCEIEILHAHKKELASFMADKNFNLIELGPGEGIKSQLLIESFLAYHLQFTYVPIDISLKYLQQLNDSLTQSKLKIKFSCIHADYFQGLKWLSSHSTHCNFILFLGSSIGNFDLNQAQLFLQQLCKSLNRHDYVLIGFDLRKDIKTLIRAYDDKAGITREFNLNLLRRINRELGANFNLEKFYHHATYNVYQGAMESYLISLEEQQVQIENTTFNLQAFEPILLEYSYKYMLSQINDLAKAAGFRVVKNFFDGRKYFVNSLLQVVPRTF